MPVADLNKPVIASFDLIIDGSPLSLSAKAYVVGITVDDSVELPSMFTVEIAGMDDPDESFPWVDDEDLFSVGNVVEIKFGYGNDLETLIKGEITALEPEFANQPTAKPRCARLRPPAPAAAGQQDAHLRAAERQRHRLADCQRSRPDARDETARSHTSTSFRRTRPTWSSCAARAAASTTKSWWRTRRSCSARAERPRANS